MCRCRPAELPDRNKPGRPIKRICKECHTQRLRNDLIEVIDVDKQKQADDGTRLAVTILRRDRGTARERSDEFACIRDLFARVQELEAERVTLLTTVNEYQNEVNAAFELRQKVKGLKIEIVRLTTPHCGTCVPCHESRYAECISPPIMRA